MCLTSENDIYTPFNKCRGSWCVIEHVGSLLGNTPRTGAKGDNKGDQKCALIIDQTNAHARIILNSANF